MAISAILVGRNSNASEVLFKDGETFQEKLDNGELTGPPGENGVIGHDGVTFTPSIDDEGILSWTNDGEKENPPSVKVQGKDGVPGKDGVSPTVTVSKEGQVATITITDSEGSKSVEINDGAPGGPGATGPEGPNTVSTTTSTNIIGLLKGNGENVSMAEAGADYVTPNGNITGNAGTATKLATPRRINITGGATGFADFDGSGDISINVSVSAKAVWG